ncbi:hypothetical protein A0128_13370 [Leptospira tipperaryensis]|uniref:YD repeat-containing protein n=1 Tax=Leptospira tipperaryensis TaxID=2564040 RepID=A0A1D7UYU4_9LEPT|nr:hypothetical protein [Leptospira tipperaryensis]AOP34751.1 hypothetical protein A0128_13370 [Leptospira tipperaryensis]
MKKILISMNLALFLFFINACKKDKSDDTTLLAGLVALASGNCFNLPQQVIIKDGNSAQTSTYNCAVVGKVYSCVPVGGGNTVVRTYSSSTAGKLGVVDPPPYSNLHAQRGLTSRVEGGTTNTFTYNSSKQLTAVASPAVVTYSNYDANGFPKTNSSAQNLVYTYAAGATIPTTSADGAFTYTYDSKGWGTKVDFGFGNPTTAENIGSVSICE